MSLEAEILDGVDRGYQAARKAEGEGKFPIRGSALGACPRKLRALLDDPEGQSIGGRSLRIFRRGIIIETDLCEALVLGLPAYTWEFQRPVWTSLGKPTEGMKVASDLDAPLPESLRIGATGELEVRSRLDALGTNADRRVIHVDIKTANTYSLKRILQGQGVGYEYVIQLLTQRAGLIREGVKPDYSGWLYEDKNDQSLHMIELDRVDQRMEEELEPALEAMLDVLGKYENGAPYQETPAVYADGVASGALPWQCNYCSVGPIRGKCCPDLNVEDYRLPGEDIHKWKIKSK